jgi:hypothetical protein
VTVGEPRAGAKVPPASSSFTLPTYVATPITEDETVWGKLSAIGPLASLPVLAAIGLVRRDSTEGPDRSGPLQVGAHAAQRQRVTGRSTMP